VSSLACALNLPLATTEQAVTAILNHKECCARKLIDSSARRKRLGDRVH